MDPSLRDDYNYFYIDYSKLYIRLKAFKFLLPLTIILFSINTIAQKLIENKVDEFTGKSVKITTQELLFKNFTTFASFKIRKIDNFCYFDFKYMQPEIFSIHKDAKLIFLMDNKVTYTLYAGEFKIANHEIYSYEETVTYINPDDLELKGLESSKIAKVRIYLSDNYVEYEIKSKNATTVGLAIKVVND